MRTKLTEVFRRIMEASFPWDKFTDKPPTWDQRTKAKSAEDNRDYSKIGRQTGDGPMFKNDTSKMQFPAGVKTDDKLSWDEFERHYPEGAKEFKKIQDELDAEDGIGPDEGSEHEDFDYYVLDNGIVDANANTTGAGSRIPSWYWFPEEADWFYEEDMQPDELERVTDPENNP